MKKYIVTVPFISHIKYEVLADSPEDAIDRRNNDFGVEVDEELIGAQEVDSWTAEEKTMNPAELLVWHMQNQLDNEVVE